MPSYVVIGNWLFLFGSLLFTFDAVDNAWQSCSTRSYIMLTACGLFTLGCVLFLIPAKKVDPQP